MAPMKKLVVSKFGGTSMNDAKTMALCAQVAHQKQSSVVVVSATSGTTNQLLELGLACVQGDNEKIKSLISTIESRHKKIASDLGLSSSRLAILDQLLQELQSLAQGIQLLKDNSARNSDALVSLGERLSSVLFTEALTQKYLNEKSPLIVELLDARKLIKTDHHFGRARPKLSEIEKLCEANLKPRLGSTVFVTQGFIGSTIENQTTTLGRGGSDFSAALFAEGLGADTLEIWTDVAGIATTDPRICKTARMLSEISFTEASELATFGAKVLHPATLMPAQRKNIPVFVGSSFNPEQAGTWVKKSVDSSPLVRALALRKNQSLVTLTTPQMWQSSGFLFQIFQVFHDHKISVDAVTTSEISVAMTLDSTETLSTEVIQKLSEFAEVQVEKNLSLISLIGNNINHTAGLAEKAFSSLPGVNIRMICQGASRHNFCFLVSDSVSQEVIQNLHHQFIDSQ